MSELEEKKVQEENELQDASGVEEEVPEKGKKKEKKKRTVGEEIMSWVCTILAALVIACVIRMFVFEPIKVDGKSMTNTLQSGELVWCDKLDYLFGEPQRNDVIICRYPDRESTLLNIGGGIEVVSHTLFVKRLVALPGDTVEISNGVLYVNGKIVEDPEYMASKPYADYARRTLGEDEYFVIGDNRGNSHDSRSSDVGPISRSDIVGHVKFVFWPLNKIRGIE